MSSSNLLTRILVAVVGIPLALGSVYLGGWALAGLVAVFAVVGNAELNGLAARAGVRPSGPVGAVGAAALPLLAYAATTGGGAVTPLVVSLVAALWMGLLLGVIMATRSPGERPLAAAAVTLFGALYAGGFPAFLLVLRHGPGLADRWAATWLVFLPLVVVWVCDTVAMAGGALLGGRKLAPVLSPNKTWAGAVSGSAAALVCGPAYGLVAPEPLGVALTWWQLAVFGLVISVVGQVGDAAESLLKREAGVKDSGRFFPGHGGVLDRFDSLYWALPTAAALLHLYGVL